MKLLPFVIVLFLSPLIAEDWPQGAGSGGNFATEQSAPVSWSVVRNENIRWKITLPETGQSTPVVQNGRVYFSTLKSVEKDSELGKDIVAWCLDAESGEIHWKREIKGMHDLRLSGCFSDSSSPPAVCDGDHVIFTNASGGVVCFDRDGKEIWKRDLFTAGRTVPFLVDRKFVFTRQIYPPGKDGNFPPTFADSPKEMWTQLLALDAAAGDDVWVSDCGVNMGSVILPQSLGDGRQVAVVGRGGGHGPPEKPDGISLVDLSDGTTIWSVPLKGFMATMSYRIRDDKVHIFHLDAHLSINAMNGDIEKRVSIVDEVRVARKEGAVGVENIDSTKKKRIITQGSNLLVGPWHYFRSYTRPYMGRVHVDRGTVEYLELPLQLSRSKEVADKLLWFSEPEGKQDRGLHQQVIVENELKNSRGFVVFGDKRSKGSGWGHIASPTPSVAGDFLYVPVMNGTVYVIRWKVDQLGYSDAVVSINDLGLAGVAWTRASLSFAGGRAFAHTMQALICIGEPDPN